MADTSLPESLRTRFTDPSLLGEGAMGRVLRARDANLDRAVAIKLLHPEIAMRADLRARFEREARALARIDHPHVVEVHDVDVADDVPYLVFAFVSGTDLERHLAAHPEGLPTEEANRLFREILLGLDAAHQAGVLHRDLKPANVLLENGTTVVLTDFGLARLEEAETLTQTGVVMGTPAYMPIDQLEGDKPGRDWDLYAAGLVYLEMLLGKLPFETGSVENVLRSKERPLNWKLALAGRRIPERLEKLLDRVLARDRSRRPDSASELIETLGTPRLNRSGDRARRAPTDVKATIASSSGSNPAMRTQVSGETPVVRAPSVPAPAPPPTGSSPALLVAVGLVTALLGAGVGRWTAPAPAPRPAEPRPLVDLDGAELARALGEKLADIESRPAIQGALALSPGTKRKAAKELYEKARAALREDGAELSELVRRLGDSPPTTEGWNRIQDLLLVQELLEIPIQPGEPRPSIFRSESDPRLRAYTRRVAKMLYEPTLGRYKLEHGEVRLKGLRTRLQSTGESWSRIFTPRVVRMDGNTYDRDDELQIQNYALETFRGRNYAPTEGLPEEQRMVETVGATLLGGHRVGGDPARSFALKSFEGDLELALAVYDWRHSFVNRLTMRGSATGTPVRLVFRPPHVPTENQYEAFILHVRVPRKLFPEPPTRLELEVFGLEPIGNPSPTVNLVGLYQRRSPARTRAGAGS